MRHNGDVEELVGYKVLCLGEIRHSEDHGVTDRKQKRNISTRRENSALLNVVGSLVR